MIKIFIKFKYKCKDYIINTNHIIDIIKSGNNYDMYIIINTINEDQIYINYDSDNLEEGNKFYRYLQSRLLINEDVNIKEKDIDDIVNKAIKRIELNTSRNNKILDELNMDRI